MSSIQLDVCSVCDVVYNLKCAVDSVCSIVSVQREVFSLKRDIKLSVLLAV